MGSFHALYAKKIILNMLKPINLGKCSSNVWPILLSILMMLNEFQMILSNPVCSD